MTVYDATVTVIYEETFDVEIEKPEVFEDPATIAAERAEARVQRDLVRDAIDAGMFDLDATATETDR